MEERMNIDPDYLAPETKAKAFVCIICVTLAFALVLAAALT